MVYFCSGLSSLRITYEVSLERTFRKIVQEAQLDPAHPLLLAVSGGVDSVVLLDLFSRLPGTVPPLRVWHLDHQIRSESAADALFVAELCRKQGIACRLEKVNVPAIAKQRRLSLETAARDMRRELLLSEAHAGGCRHIVLAHHRDDQAETFLQRMLRGTGKTGLCGMRTRDGLWWRPLLTFSRQDILDYAAQCELTWVEDVSNESTVYLRNRIRHQLLPELTAYNPRIKERLAALSHQFQQEEDFWQEQIDLFWPKVLISESDGLRLGRAALLKCHPALRARLLRSALERVRGDLRGIESVHLESLQGLIGGARPQASIDLPACWVARRYESVWFRRSAPQSVPFSLELALGKTLILPDGRGLRAELTDRVCGEVSSLVEFDAQDLVFPLAARSVQPGDRFTPSGMRGQRKLKDFMIDSKLEREERSLLPLLLFRDEILWLVGVRRSALRPATNKSNKILVIRLLDAVEKDTNSL
ncbi:MAG: tRNA lysidine(34) synthetase TilS [Geopsychrobacter sp.]|nr:tRNA lysidine(34) synthetase TilS [Geopsychrobacter sp.]